MKSVRQGNDFENNGSNLGEENSSEFDMHCAERRRAIWLRERRGNSLTNNLRSSDEVSSKN